MALFRMKPQYRKRTKQLKYKGTAPNLSASVYQNYGVSFNNYAIFAGGYTTNSGSSGYQGVDVYDASLTKSNCAVLNDSYTGDIRGASTQHYAIFGTGTNGSSRNNTPTAYNTSLVRTICSSLNFSVSMSAAASVGEYILFGGGYY